MSQSNNHGSSSAQHSNHPSYTSSNNPSVSNNNTNNTNNSVIGSSTGPSGGSGAVGSSNMSNLSNIMSMNTSSSVQNSTAGDTGERINHSSPSKQPVTGANTTLNGVTGVGSQGNSIQGSAGGAGNNVRPSMT